MTEPKPYWIGGYQPTGKPPEVLSPPKGGSNVIEPKQGYSISPEKPTKLPQGPPPQPIYQGYQPQGNEPYELYPPTGGTGVQKPLTINGQSLSEKQLHELIISQSMTIDRLLTRQGELVDMLKRVRDLLLNYKFYEAWIEINRALG